MAARLRRRLPPGQPVHNPVAAVLPGRRNNPPEPGIRSLAVFNPIHYFELPELFMEFICSMTGKSPSTTGAGSEGALTKGPFNALPPIIDLNNALVSFILTGHHGFVTAAGYVGPKVRVDHDISLLVPEVWCRMTPEERDPQFLIAGHYLEKCEDFEHAGKKVLASRLGYRINARFVHTFFGARVQSSARRVHRRDAAPGTAGPGHFCGRHGQHRHHAKARRENVFRRRQHRAGVSAVAGAAAHHAERRMGGQGTSNIRKSANCSRANHLLASDWYAARLAAKQKIDRQLWRRHVDYLDRFLKRASHADEAARLGIADRLVARPENAGGGRIAGIPENTFGHARRGTD